jgi:lipopolysaccharide export system protein LptC
MIPSSPKSERMAGTILIALLLAVVVIGAFWFYLHKKNEKEVISIEEAMYVSDWDITKIYGPGTPEQAVAVKKFKSQGKIDFTSPVLYRMGKDKNINSNEGVLLLPFDPKNPKMALQLKEK